MSTFRSGQAPVAPGLPVGYLQKGYFDNKGNILPEVILDWPRDIARNLASSRPQMKTAQLRGRFFAEVRRLETRLESVKDYDAIRSDVLKLSVYAEQGVNKGKVPSIFKQFIDANVKLATKGQKEFKAFVDHFECVVGFFPEIR